MRTMLGTTASVSILRRAHLRWAAFIAAILCLALPAGAQQPVVIQHAYLIDGTGRPPVPDATVVVRDGKIASVGPSAGFQIPPGAKVIDAKGNSLLPGLADMHVHLFVGWDGASADLLNYQRYLQTLLYSGVTTVLDTGNVQPYILQLRQEVAAGRLAGPRIYCTGMLIDGADPIFAAISFAVTSRAQLPRVVRMQAEDKVDAIKVYVGLSDATVRHLVAQARQAHLKVLVDQWWRNGSLDLMHDGITGFAHVGAAEMPEEAIRLARAKNLPFITTLAVYESFSGHRLSQSGFWTQPLVADTIPKWAITEIRAENQRTLTAAEKSAVEKGERYLRAATDNARRLHRAGLLLVAGTDAPYPGDYLGEGIHRELELLVEAGLSPLEAITAATRNAALLMDADQQWGTVEPGKLANLLLVRGHPDQHIGDTRNIELVMKEGTVVDRDAIRQQLAADPGFRPVKTVSVHPEETPMDLESLISDP